MTAVEYLIKEFSNILGKIQTEPLQDLFLIDAIKEAKEMEKQQQGYNGEDMREAFEVGFIIGYKDEESTDSLTLEEWFEQFKNK